MSCLKQQPDISSALFSDFELNAFMAPKWFRSRGLHKYPPLLTMLRSSWEHWGQAAIDGNEHLAPIIIIYNLPAAEIKKKVGGHTWHRIRTSTTTTNCNRMVLRLIGGWTLEETMHWPEQEKRHAKALLKYTIKSELLTACKHTRKGERVIDNITMLRDITRMGGTIDTNWGRKRLKKEHDALAIKEALKRADPTPWAKPWFCDVGDYTFSLLKSGSELAIEGATQRHCCQSYARACRAGTETVFSIMGPERATMSFNSRTGELQIAGYANKQVSKKTQAAAGSCWNIYATKGAT